MSFAYACVWVHFLNRWIHYLGAALLRFLLATVTHLHVCFITLRCLEFRCTAMQGDAPPSLRT